MSVTLTWSKSTRKYTRKEKRNSSQFCFAPTYSGADILNIISTDVSESRRINFEFHNVVPSLQVLEYLLENLNFDDKEIEVFLGACDAEMASAVYPWVLRFHMIDSLYVCVHDESDAVSKLLIDMPPCSAATIQTCCVEKYMLNPKWLKESVDSLKNVSIVGFNGDASLETKFSNLKKIVLFPSFDTFLDQGSVQKTFSSSYSSLKELVMSSVQDSDVKDLQWLSQCPHLQMLELKCTLSNKKRDETQIVLPSLQRLFIHIEDDIRDDMWSIIDVPMMTSLHLPQLKDCLVHVDKTIGGTLRMPVVNAPSPFDGTFIKPKACKVVLQHDPNRPWKISACECDE